MRVLLAVLAVVLAGCSEAPAAIDAEGTAPWVVEGRLLDEALRPIDATVSVLGTAHATTTDATGRWVLPIPHQENTTFVLQAEAQGFAPDSAPVSFTAIGERRHVDLELVRLADTAPRVEVVDHQGFIACSGFVAAGHNHGGGDPQPEDEVDCSAGTDSHHLWDLTVPAELAGMVVELAWEANQPGAENLLVLVHELDANGEPEGEALAFGEGTSPLRLPISSLALESRFSEGGAVRIAVHIGGGPDQEDVAFGLAVQQEFRAYASFFWNEGPGTEYAFVQQ